VAKYRSRRERKASKVVDAGFSDENVKGHENSIEPDTLKKGGRVRHHRHGGHVEGEHAKHHMAKRARGGSGIHIKESHKGLLHKQMGIPEGKPISTKALEHEKQGANPAEKKRIVFAENARRWHHE
jgi:hypothetical protein